MIKKGKLLASIASLCIALVALVVGIYASQALTYKIQGSLGYNAEHAFITVEAKTYKYIKQALTPQSAQEMLKTDRSALIEIEDLTNTYCTYDENGLMKQDITDQVFDNYDFEYRDAFAFFIVLRVWSIQEVGIVKATITDNISISNTWAYNTGDIGIPVNNTGVEIVLAWGIEDSTKTSTGMFNYNIAFDVLDNYTPLETGNIQAVVKNQSTNNETIVEQTYNQYTEIGKTTKLLSVEATDAHMGEYRTEDLSEVLHYSVFTTVNVGNFMVDNKVKLELVNAKFFDENGNEIEKPEAQYIITKETTFGTFYEYEAYKNIDPTAKNWMSFRLKKLSFELKAGESKQALFGIVVPNREGTGYQQVAKITFDIQITTQELPVEDEAEFDYRYEIDILGNVYIWPGKLVDQNQETLMIDTPYFDIIQVENKVMDVTFKIETEEDIMADIYNSYMLGGNVYIPGAPAEVQGNPLAITHARIAVQFLNEYGYLPVVKQATTMDIPNLGAYTFKPENWLSDMYYFEQLTANMGESQVQSLLSTYYRPAPTGDTFTVPVSLYKVENFSVDWVFNLIVVFGVPEMVTLQVSCWASYSTIINDINEGTATPEQYGLSSDFDYYEFLTKFYKGEIPSTSYTLNEDHWITAELYPIIPGEMFDISDIKNINGEKLTPKAWSSSYYKYDTIQFNSQELINISGLNTKAFTTDLIKYDIQDGVLYTADKILHRYPTLKDITEYQIVEGTMAISESAFAKAKNLTTLTFAQTVSRYGENLFAESNIGVLNLHPSNLLQDRKILLESIKNSNITKINIFATSYIDDDIILEIKASTGIEASIIYEENGVLYEARNDGAHIIGVTDTTKTFFVLPETVTISSQTYNVVGIDANAFASCTALQNINMPTTLKTIGNNNFGSCTSLKILNLETASITSFGTGNTHPELAVYTKQQSVYNLLTASYSNSIGLDWQNLIDGGIAEFSYTLTIGTTTHTIGGKPIKGNTNMYDRFILLFPTTTDALNVTLSEYVKAYADTEKVISGIQEQTSFVLDNGDGTYTTVFGTASDATNYNQYTSSTVTKDYPLSGSAAVSVAPGSKLRLKIYYTVLQEAECFTENTVVTMADGTYKAIKDVTYDDLLMVYDFDNGQFGASYPVWITTPDEYDYYYIMEFDDGSSVEIVLNHRLFNDDTLDFTKTISPEYENIGKKFPRQVMENGVPVIKLVTCTNITRINEVCTYYNMVTSQEINFIANGFIGGPSNINMYEFVKVDDQTYLHNQEQLNASQNGDIFEYERYNTEIIPYYIYVAYRLGELKNMAKVISKYPPFNSMTMDFVEAGIIGEINNYFGGDYFDYMIEAPKELKVTFSDRQQNQTYSKGDLYTLPTPSETTNFAGWYNTFDGKIYQSGDIVELYMNTHFIARYSA